MDDLCIYIDICTGEIISSTFSIERINRKSSLFGCFCIQSCMHVQRGKNNFFLGVNIYSVAPGKVCSFSRKKHFFVNGANRNEKRPVNYLPWMQPPSNKAPMLLTEIFLGLPWMLWWKGNRWFNENKLQRVGWELFLQHHTCQK